MDAEDGGSQASRLVPSSSRSDREQLTDDLASSLSQLTFELSGPDRAELLATRDRMVDLIRDMQARLERPGAPLLAVVGGGTGAGKSTTVNTLAGRAITAPGVLRPTTRVPTLVCHPDDLPWFDDQRVLPDLVRVSAEAQHADDSGDQLRLATSTELPQGLALLDIPDIDSVDQRNHRLADRALDAADVWLWLATVRTYADQVGMEYVQLAQSRRARIAVAITQAREGQQVEIEPDVDRLLTSAGVHPDLRAFIPYAEVVDGQLPTSAVTELRAWLEALARSADQRSSVRDQAIAGLQASLPEELAPLLTAVDSERRAARGLQAVAATRFAGVADGLGRDLEAGLPLRADVMNRWQHLVGGNESLLKVQTAAGKLGELVRSRLRMPTTENADEVRVEVATELTNSITTLLERAHREVRRGLEERSDGRALLDAAPQLRTEPPRIDAQVRAVVSDWEGQVSTLIDEVGGPGKARAKRLSTGLNAVATSAILVLFALSGGLTGGEVGIAAGAAAANQWLLTRLLGEQNVRRLLERINEDLFERVGVLSDEQRRRYDDAITAVVPDDEHVEALRRAVDAGR